MLTERTNENSSDEGEKLILAYRQDSGLLLVLSSMINGRAVPSSGCKMCSTTFNIIGSDPKWKEFANELGIPLQFVPQEDFERKFPSIPYDLPAGFIVKGKDIRLLISKEEMAACSNIDQVWTL